MEDIFELAAFAALEERLAEANRILDAVAKGRALQEISIAFARAGGANRAIAVAESIPSGIERWYVLIDISRVLIQDGNINGVIAVADSIPNEEGRWFVLQSLAEVLALDGDIPRALAVAKLISKPRRGEILWIICKALLRAGNADGATAVAESIPNEAEREVALWNIRKSEGRDYSR